MRKISNAVRSEAEAMRRDGHTYDEIAAQIHETADVAAALRFWS